LVTALGATPVAGMGIIPARRWHATAGWQNNLGAIDASPAALELARRHARSPRQLATELAAHYGRDFDQPWYIGAIALIARIRLGDTDAVRRLAEPWVDGTRD